MIYVLNLIACAVVYVLSLRVLCAINTTTPSHTPNNNPFRFPPLVCFTHIHIHTCSILHSCTHPHPIPHTYIHPHPIPHTYIHPHPIPHTYILPHPIPRTYTHPHPFHAHTYTLTPSTHIHTGAQSMHTKKMP